MFLLLQFFFIDIFDHKSDTSGFWKQRQVLSAPGNFKGVLGWAGYWPTDTIHSWLAGYFVEEFYLSRTYLILGRQQLAFS